MFVRMRVSDSPLFPVANSFSLGKRVRGALLPFALPAWWGSLLLFRGEGTVVWFVLSEAFSDERLGFSRWRRPFSLEGRKKWFVRKGGLGLGAAWNIAEKWRRRAQIKCQFATGAGRLSSTSSNKFIRGRAQRRWSPRVARLYCYCEVIRPHVQLVWLQ